MAKIDPKVVGSVVDFSNAYVRSKSIYFRTKSDYLQRDDLKSDFTRTYWSESFHFSKLHNQGDRG